MVATWTTMFHEEIPLQFMTNKHVQNCIGYISTGRMSNKIRNGFSNSEWIAIFKAELTRRNRSTT
jgi:hypothetical protein